jgi:RNA polymerase sigma factor (sigma-70 family)
MGSVAPRETRFEELFESHYWAVRAYALRRASSASVADDVVSETFLVAWRRLDGIGGDALPWLLGVARRLLANQRRAERRRGALVARLAGLRGEPDVWEPPAAMNGRLAEALASLSAREREALLLVAWEELEPGRAAQVVGCSPAAFRVRLHRARQRVASALDQSPSAVPHSAVPGEAP